MEDLQMKPITHSMHWGWKVSFSCTLFLLITTWVSELTTVSTLWSDIPYWNPDPAVMTLGSLPFAVWMTVRWIVIGNQAKEG